MACSYKRLPKIGGRTVKRWRNEITFYPPVNVYSSAEIGKGTNIGMFAEIGDMVNIGTGCKIGGHAFIPKGVTLGNDVFIGPHVMFCNDKHPKAKGLWECLKTVVEDGASIGANSTILPGITIGKGAIIGAGSVVTKNIPPGETWCGNPAIRMENENSDNSGNETGVNPSL